MYETIGYEQPTITFTVMYVTLEKDMFHIDQNLYMNKIKQIYDDVDLEAFALSIKLELLAVARFNMGPRGPTDRTNSLRRS